MMPIRRRSGAAAFLLVVSCVVVVSCCAATDQQHQQQQQPSPITVPAVRIIPLRRIIEQAVRAELQSRKCESKTESPDSGSESRKDADDQNSQMDMLITKVESHNSQLEKLEKQESQLIILSEKLDILQTQLDVLTNTSTNTSSSEQSRLDRAVNKTASQQTQIDELAVRLDQVESEGGPGGSEPLPSDCSELSAGSRSGIYLMQLGQDRSQLPVAAYCDMVTDGGKWTVFQRRTNIEPHQDFYLGWAAYKEGFGELTGEFWWGLEKLWTMTSAPDVQYELRIDIESFDGDKGHAIYQSFRISSEADGYRLNVENYSGDVGDILSHSVNQQFSTRDRDQDGWSRVHCAQVSKGAWWHGDYGCSFSILNGPYLDGPADDREGIWWYTWKEYQSLKKAEMKLRRV